MFDLNIMFRVIILHLCFILSTLGQELSYLPEFLHGRPQQVHDYSNQLIQDGPHAHHYGLPVKVYRPNTSALLSKLYKPRPAELDNILMGYEDQINTSHLKPRNFYRPENPNEEKILKTRLQHIGKHHYKHPIPSHTRLNGQKEYAEYYKKAFYSKLKPAYVSQNNNYDDSFGYKTAEVVSEEDPEYNYDFSYSVSHPDYNLNFGHKEDKHGKLTKGIYYALLPDGRTQYVEYEADEKGYKPRITYDNHNNGQYR